MEKIKEALKKAKSQSTDREVKPKASTKVSVSSVEKNEEDLNAIRYVNTKTAELDPVHLEKNRIVAFNKGGASSWVFDKLRTQVLQKMHEKNWKTIAVLSPTPESGKTFVAINLAISIANQPQKTVMLVDLDLRKPKIAKYLGLQCSNSLNDYIDNSTDIADILIHPNVPHLVILPTSHPVNRPAEVLSSSKINNLIEDISQRYESRIVVYDLPPILNTDDALIMMDKVDCILFVVGNGMVKEAEIEEAMHYIPSDKLLGVVLNKSDDSAEEYYY